MITTLKRQVIKRCPFKNEMDAGELTIVIDGPAPELHALGGQVDEIAAKPVSHEDFTVAVAELVPGCAVLTTWRTGPWSVEVREGNDDLLREPVERQGA